MSNKVNCIMLIDDNSDDNFFHGRVIKQFNSSINVIAKQTGFDAIDYLKSKKENECLHPDLIFLDINMPGMNGWEFLEEYNKLEEKFKSHAIVVMLTTSENPDDKLKAQTLNLASDFQTKPLTKGMLQETVDKYFN